MPTTPITLPDLTQAKVDGTGAFDTLMRSMVGHLELEFNKGRLRGADYANVYLNALTPVLQNAVVFLLQKDEAANKAALVDAQVRLTEVQILLAEAELERELIQKELVQAQVDKLKAETINVQQQLNNLKSEDILLNKQAAKLDADTDISVQQLVNLKSEDIVLTKQALKLDADTINTQQQLNNLLAEECVLKSQFDINKSQNLQVISQTSLVNQKVATEKAQTSGLGIEPTSVIGKQITLYAAQAEGFKRDAEQKAAKIMIDSWNVRRTTDVGTVADATNQLNDPNVGRAVSALLGGVGA